MVLGVSADKAICSLVLPECSIYLIPSPIVWAEACTLHDPTCICLYIMCCNMSDVYCITGRSTFLFPASSLQTPPHSISATGNSGMLCLTLPFHKAQTKWSF